MVRIGLRSLLAHKLRMSMAVLAVLLGTGFVSGTFVFTDALSRILDGAVEGSATDLSVRARPAVGSAGPEGPGDTPVAQADLAKVAATDGVRTATGSVTVLGVFLLDAQGKVVGSGEAPGAGVAWTGMGGTRTVTSGSPPSGPSEVVLDERSAEAAGAGVGGRVTLLLPSGERTTMTVSGLFVPPGAEIGGNNAVAFAPRTAQSLLLEPGTWSEVQVELEPGASADAVRSAVAARLGDGFDVETRAEQIRASKEELAGVVNVFTYVLLGFAVVSLLVGGFLVVNTFSMLVAQRSREMALLRAVGARRRQVTRALLLEAGVLGLVGALLGAVAGVGVALGLAELLGATGLDLTITPSLPPTAIVASLVVGVGVTLAAAYLPTRRAGRIAPVQALRESVSVPDGPPVRRLVIGLVLLALSAAAFVVGERADGTGGKAAWAGLGGLVLVAAAVALTPAVAALLTRVLPRSRSAAARLARANTVRNPRRTAATASALMVGLALVTGVTVVASSITASIGKVVDDDDFKVDYAVSASFVPVQPALLQRIEAAPGVGSVVTQQGFQVLAGGTEAGATANGGAPLSSAFAVERVAGRVDTVAPGTFIADEETAEGRGWTVGSEVPFTFVNGAERTLRLAGTYTGTALVSGIQTDLRDYRSATGDRGADVVFVTAAPGASKAELKAALDRATADNPLMRVEDREAVKDRAGSSISTLLGLIYGLLLLSMIIAVLGVVNTMAMSVLERTREIGLLRAIGLTRRQSRAMVRRESVLVSLLGAVLGVATGLVVGTMLQRALAGTGIDQLAIPYGSIAAFFVLSALIGVVAALAPARRAARMDVLQAVAAT